MQSQLVSEIPENMTECSFETPYAAEIKLMICTQTKV